MPTEAQQPVAPLQRASSLKTQDSSKAKAKTLSSKEPMLSRSQASQKTSRSPPPLPPDTHTALLPALNRTAPWAPAISTPISQMGKHKRRGSKPPALRHTTNKELCNFSSIYWATIYCMLANARYFCLAKVTQVGDS